MQVVDLCELYNLWSSNERETMTTMQDVDRRLTVVETRLENLATKSDLAAFDSRMGTFATKTDLAEFETRLVKWMIGVLIGATVAASSVAVLVQSLIS